MEQFNWQKPYLNFPEKKMQWYATATDKQMLDRWFELHSLLNTMSWYQTRGDNGVIMQEFKDFHFKRMRLTDEYDLVTKLRKERGI